MKINPQGDGGRLIEGDTPWGKFRVELSRCADGGGTLAIVDGAGKRVGTATILMRHPLPEGYRAEQALAGGCGCEPPAASGE